MSKAKSLIIFILGIIIGLSNLVPSFAEPVVVSSSVDTMSSKYANNLLRVKLVKTTDGKINLILHTTKAFDNTIYPIKKTDFEYIVLLPETYHSITSKPDFTDLIDDIRDVQINLVPYIGVKTNNGYTKVIIQTKKRDLDLVVSNESLELAKVMDRELDKVLKDKLHEERTIDDITPVPLEKPVKKVSMAKKKPVRKRVVKTYRKTTKKVSKPTVKKISNTSKPKVELKKVLEVSKTQKVDKKNEIKPDVAKTELKEEVKKEPVNHINKEEAKNPSREVVQKRLSKKMTKPVSSEKQSPLTGLLGNKWLYIIGLPLLLILFALRNMSKSAYNQAQYAHLNQEYGDEDYYQQEDMDSDEFEDDEGFGAEEISEESDILAGMNRDKRREKSFQEPEFKEETSFEEEISFVEVEEPAEEILYDEEEILLEDEESGVEILTSGVGQEPLPDELEEISPDELEEIELEEEVPVEERVSPEELESVMQEEPFELDEQHELFEDIEIEEEFKLNEQEDLFEDIDVQEEVLLDPEIVAKAYDEVKEREFEVVASQEEPVQVVQEHPVIEQAKPAIEPKVAVAANPVYEAPVVKEAQDELAASMAMQGLNVLDSKRVDMNKGFYLVELNNKKALIGFINNEYDVLHRFAKDVVSELRIKKTEEKPNEDIYLVEAKPWRALVSVSQNAMKIKLIL